MKKGMRPLVIGNWKMNPQSLSLARKLGSDVKKRVVRISDVDVVIAPPFPYLETVRSVRSERKSFMLGAQNAHHESQGAHTGEVSLPMLRGLDVEYVIVGHSERRAAGERDEDVHLKTAAVIKCGLTAVLCVGEVRRDAAGHYLTFIEKQLRSALENLSKAKLRQIVIAYEPIWAIGTGENATPADVHEMRLFIEKIVSDIYGRTFAQRVRILYGGSVTAKNARELFTAGTVHGFLVGGASLRAAEFIEIVNATRA